MHKNKRFIEIYIAYINLYFLQKILIIYTIYNIIINLFYIKDI